MPDTPMPQAIADLRVVDFADLAGWEADDHVAVFATFRRSARLMATEPPIAQALGVSGLALQRIARLALAEADDVSQVDARRFFEHHFQPMAVHPSEENAFLTGYFEPEVAGSMDPTDIYRYPLYARPDDLLDVNDGNRPEGWDPTCPFGRRTDLGIVPYFDRGEIEDGALVGRGLELVYLADPFDVFFIHVQGSASIRLGDGTRMRISYAAKSGHPYTSIGKRLIERGLARPETMTLAHLREWLSTNGVEAANLMRENRSYIFFRELTGMNLEPGLGAVAAAGVQITPGRSLAVDRMLHTYGTPIWINAMLPLGVDGAMEHVSRLMIAQDTGSAIVGAARGDMFIGLGSTAGEIAGRIRHVPQAFVLLNPK